MEIYDAHKIVTNFFNIELNKFISKYTHPEVEVIVRSEGFMQFREVEGKFLFYAIWLKEFREKFFENYIQEEISFETVKKQFGPLLDFFVRVSLRSSLLDEEVRKTLDKELLKPMMNLFKQWDKFFDNNYFMETIKSELNNPPKVTFVVKNFFSPATNADIEVSYLANIEFKEFSREVPLATLITDENGFAIISLPKGGYKFRFGFSGHKKTMFDNVNDSKIINIRFYNFIELIKYALKKFSKYLFKK
jgi:hypothetical protein